MKLLAFDTSTEVLSIAISGGAAVPAYHGPGGAQASAALIPAIEGMLAQAGLTLADLDAIVFGRGPGSFTGLRTACAVAQGLAFGTRVPVVPVDTLMAVAEDARERAGCTHVVAVLDARMDEVYCAAYAFDGTRWQVRQAPALARPEQVEVPPGWAVAGNAPAACWARMPGAQDLIAALPTAEALLRLAPVLIAAGHAVPAAQALPLYIRDKVAQTTEERAALREQQKPAAANAVHSK